MVDLFRPAYIKGYGIEITQGQDWVQGFRCKPRSDQDVLYLEDTTGYTATMKVRASDASGAEQLSIGTGTGEITVGFTPGKVARNTAYGLGQKVVPLALNGYVYEVTVAGTSHASNEPAWPTTLGNTVTDGTVTWRCETTDETVCNLYIAIPRATAAALVPWGRGVYSLEVIDSFSHTWVYLDGPAYLRAESTY